MAEMDSTDPRAQIEALGRRLRELEDGKARSEAMLQSLVDSVPDVIYRLDGSGRIVFISDAVRRYGYEPGELVGAAMLELIHPDDRPRSQHRVNERRTGQRSTRSLQVRLLSGPHAGANRPGRAMEVHASGMYGSMPARSESFLGTQGVARDVTERLHAEEALRQADRARVFTETAGAAAHEINQPLTALSGGIQMLQADLRPTDPLHQRLAELLEAVERIDHIIGRMLAAHRYVTKPYAGDTSIVDFEASSREDGE